MEIYTHQPVMLDPVLESLRIQAAGYYLDATFGRGGHARAVLARLGPSGRLFVNDRDPSAIDCARALAAQDSRVQVLTGPFSELESAYPALASQGLDGILLDLGVSSPQLEEASRGFSFRLEGPLDMRMDPNFGVPASTWLNKVSVTDLSRVLKVNGEERHHRRIAEAIKQACPLYTTTALAEVIKAAHPAWERHHHPATKSFQAIRIEINQEFEQIDLGLQACSRLLAPGGRLSVLSFHSLEDRRVKLFMKNLQDQDQYPAKFPIRQQDIPASPYRVLKKQLPGAAEIASNVRARSAVLRCLEKI